MVVKTIRAKADGDQVAVTFTVDAKTWRNMRRAAQAGANPDTENYIADVINAAFLATHRRRKRMTRPSSPHMDDGIPS